MTAPSPGKREGRAGFLLVEALSALALGALILVALLSLTGLLRRSADRAAWGVETTEVTSRTIDTIAQEVRRAARRRWAAPPEPAGARPTPRPAAPAAASNDGPESVNRPPGSGQQAGGDPQAPDGEGDTGEADPGPERPFAFAGAPDRVMFALTPTQSTGLRAPVFVVWQIDASGAVLRAEGPLTPDALGPAGVTLGDPARIDPGPERLKFAFVDRQPSGDEVIVDAWTEPMRMPAAVRIDRMDPRTGVVIGALRVPLLIDGEPGCAGKRGACSRVADKGEGAAGQARTPPNDPANAPEGER